MESQPDVTSLLIQLQGGRREAFGESHYYVAAAVAIAHTRLGRLPTSAETWTRRS
jgi:hypothetical protein